MRKHLVWLTIVLISALTIVGCATVSAQRTAEIVSGSLDELPRLKDFTAARISSWDQTGGNRDALRVEPGETKTLAEISGPGCITHIWCTIGAEEQWYSERLVLRAYWDGTEWPSIEAPIGDFFCAGHGMNATVNSLPIRVTSNGRARNCFFKMPFAKSAKLTVTNEGTKPVGAFYYFVDYKKYVSPQLDLGYFHAQYRQAKPCKSWVTPSTSREEQLRKTNLTGEDNYVILETEGRGHYVGCNLSIRNNAPGWWGEGDDMIFVDGDKWPPSFHGTGSEDYFCDAWGMRELEGLFYGSPICEPDEVGGRCTVYRFHIADPIPFTKSIKMTIEHGHANDRSDDFSSVAYWYQRPIAKRFPPLPPVEERLPRQLDGYVDLAFAEIAATSEGDSVQQAKSDARRLLNDGIRASFRANAPGDFVAFKVPVEKSGDYLISVLGFSKPNNGIVQLKIDGKPQGEAIDQFNLKREEREMPQSLRGVTHLDAGTHEFRFEVVGKNSQSDGYNVDLIGVALLPATTPRAPRP